MPSQATPSLQRVPCTRIGKLRIRTTLAHGSEGAVGDLQEDVRSPRPPTGERTKRGASVRDSKLTASTNQDRPTHPLSPVTSVPPTREIKKRNIKREEEMLFLSHMCEGQW